jgi:hypothetical protein
MTVAYVNGDMASWIESTRLLCKAMLPLPSNVAQKVFGRGTYATYIQMKYNFVLFSYNVSSLLMCPMELPFSRNQPGFLQQN